MRYKKLLVTGISLFSFGFHSIGQYHVLPDSLCKIEPKPVIITKPVTVRSFFIPAALIITGAQSIHSNFFISNDEVKEERDEHFIRFHTSVDNYLQFAPIAAGYGMLFNYPQHRFWPYTKKVLLTEAIMMALVYPTKQLVGEQRPDNSTANSFPSGHTAQAFAGATIFCDEFARHNFWLQASAYSGAAAIGVFRVLNNRHWAGDVLAGAGFGILSAKLSEWILDPHGHKSHQSFSSL